MAAVRHPALRAAETADADAFQGDIPTLEIEVAALRIPTLAEPVRAMHATRTHPGRQGPAAANTVEGSRPIDARRRTSRRIIAAVALGLIAVACLASVFEAVVAGGAEAVAAGTEVTRAQSRIPTLVLLSESSRAPSLPSTTRRLMDSTAALLATRQLLDQATIDFALLSLQTVLLADTQNRAARQRLEEFTRQLADEATKQFDKGNHPLARRLIQQALNSGVALEHVRLAAAYVTPQTGR